MGQAGCLALGKLFATAGPLHWFPQREHTEAVSLRRRKEEGKVICAIINKYKDIDTAFCLRHNIMSHRCRQKWLFASLLLLLLFIKLIDKLIINVPIQIWKTILFNLDKQNISELSTYRFPLPVNNSHSAGQPPSKQTQSCSVSPLHNPSLPASPLLHPQHHRCPGRTAVQTNVT